jgi:hypothetical protein
MVEFSGAEALLLEVLGLPFLSFVLNSNQDDVARRLQDGSRLSSQHEAVLAELVGFLGTLPRTDPFSISLSLSVLGEHNPSLGSSWAVAARVNAGGDIDLPERTDSIGVALLALIRDMYPLFLLPPMKEPFGHLANIGRPLFSHPQRSDFESAVLADPKLNRLFPDENEHVGRHGYMYRSTGSGGTMQLAVFAGILLSNGWEFATREEESASLRRFAEETLKLLDVIRDAIDGKTVTVPAFVGITGIRLPSAGRIALPWGYLREMTAADQRRVPPGLSGKLQGTNEEGVSVEIDYAGDVVMELEVPYKILVGRVEDASTTWPIQPLNNELVARYLETLSLAILLPWEGTSRPIVVGTWTAFLDPLAKGLEMSWRDSRRLPSLVPTKLAADQATAWSEWADRVHRGRVANIDIAVRRTLLAAVERADPTDALVDAVIAWENLLGSGQGESTLRISTAMAWLLGNDAHDRQTTRKRVADLYGLRSKVLHGDRV